MRTKEDKLRAEIERLNGEAVTISKRRSRLRWLWLPMLLVIPAALLGGAIAALLTLLVTFSYFGVTAYIVYIRRFAIDQEIQEIQAYLVRLSSPPREPRPSAPLGVGLSRYRRQD